MRIRLHHIIVFILGVFTGLFLYWAPQSHTIFIAARERIQKPNINQPHVDSEPRSSQLLQSENERGFKDKNLVVKEHGQDHSRAKLPETVDQVISNFGFIDGHLHGVDTIVADELSKNIRILCLVFTHAKNHLTKAPAVNATWGQRCTKFLFITNQEVPSLPTLVLNVSDGRQFLTEKTRQSFNYATDYIDDYDWFMKADDDTYVIMENLRYLLSEFDPNEALYFGSILGKRIYHIFSDKPIAHGGAGYVISREALRRYREKSHRLCYFKSGSEDINFGMCMAALEVPLMDSTDALGKTRFHCFNPLSHLKGEYAAWFNNADKYKGRKKGISDMSDYAISFHYVSPDDILLLEYSVYHLSPYGIIKGLQDLNVHSTAIH